MIVGAYFHYAGGFEPPQVCNLHTSPILYFRYITRHLVFLKNAMIVLSHFYLSLDYTFVWLTENSLQ